MVSCAGATIQGRVTLGRDSAIAGNVWLTRSLPPDSNITQVGLQVTASEPWLHATLIHSLAKRNSS